MSQQQDFCDDILAEELDYAFGVSNLLFHYTRFKIIMITYRFWNCSEQHEVMVPLTRVLYYVTGWIAGIIADTLVRKKVLLVISVLYTSAG